MLTPTVRVASTIGRESWKAPGIRSRHWWLRRRQRPEQTKRVRTTAFLMLGIALLYSLLAGACVLAVQRIALTGLIGSFALSVPWQVADAVAGACDIIGVLTATITSATRCAAAWSS